MKYKACFFDWDGTAVESRKASVEEAVSCIRELLRQKVYMIIISGTTYDKIAGGKLHDFFTEAELSYLRLGLGRGAMNYSFEKGLPVLHSELIPDREERILIHKIAFNIHEKLLREYGVDTDVVFSRPNYCKLDLMVDHDRKDKLFLQRGEISMVQELLKEHGIHGGLSELAAMAAEEGKKLGLRVEPTTDAKYLEVGTTTKSDNINFFIRKVLMPAGIPMEDVCCWGDEFTYLSEGVKGSDAYMMVKDNESSDFYDVSSSPWKLPEGVVHQGGGTRMFLGFLKKQAEVMY